MTPKIAKLFFAAAFFCPQLFLLPAAAYAAESAKVENKPAPSASADKEPTPEELQARAKKATEEQAAIYKKAMDATQKALVDMGTLTQPEDIRHFYMMYNNYNLIATAKTVRADVGNAITKCGESNPDMKQDLDSRFKSWAGAVDPVLEEAQANIENMVMAQEYADPKKVRHVFEVLDSSRAETNAALQKTPVTTVEGCQYLQGKMKETQDNLVSLLRSTLVSFSRTYQPDPSAQDHPAATETPDKPPEPAAGSEDGKEKAQ